MIRQQHTTSQKHILIIY